MYWDMIIILHLFWVSFTIASKAAPKIFANVLWTKWNHLFANKGQRVRPWVQSSTYLSVAFTYKKEAGHKIFDHSHDEH